MILHHFVSQLRVCAPSVSWPPANQPNWLSSQTFLPTNQCPLFSLIINQAFPPFASDYKRKKLIFWLKKMHRYTNGSSPINNFLFSKQLHPRVGNCYVITMLHYRSLWVETKQNSWVVTESNLRIRWQYSRAKLKILRFLALSEILFLFCSQYSFIVPLAFMADLSSLLCLGALRASPLHSAITLTLFTLVLRSGSIGDPWALCSEPDGVLEGDTDWLVGQPVSSIVDRHTDSNSQEWAAQGRQSIAT